MDIEQFFRQEQFATGEALGKLDIAEFEKAYKVLKNARDAGRPRVWIFGNGGSAATASHFANDLWKMANMPAVALPDLTPTMLAYGNDDGWGQMFAQMLSMDGTTSGNVLVGISCSGNSRNVINAMNVGSNYKIVLTGDQGGELKDCDPDAIIYARHPDIRIQENIHLIVCHMLAGALKND